MSQGEIRITLTQQADYQFLIDFGPDLPGLLADEPEPLGHGLGPAPSHLLVSAAANCLAASLLFSLRKFKQNPDPIRAEASGVIERNEAGRLRMRTINVTLQLGRKAVEMEHLQRVLDTFESFCTVSQSIQSGVQVNVVVEDADGVRVK